MAKSQRGFKGNNRPMLGPQHSFFTFSSADLHWPELHALFTSGNIDTTVENRHENVINNPHITDWFFTQRMKSFVEHWP